MKTLLSTLMALLLCGSLCAQGEEKYTIRGTLPDDSFDGLTVYLHECYPHDSIHFTVIDSSVVKDRRFVFKGRTEEPALASVHISARQIDGTSLLPPRAGFILEPGKIEIAFDGATRASVAGTQLNEEFDSAIGQNIHADKKAFIESHLKYPKIVAGMIGTFITTDKDMTERWIDRLAEPYRSQYISYVGYITERTKELLDKLPADHPVKQTYATSGPQL